MAGLTIAGFVPKTREETLAELDADIRALVGQTTDTDPSTGLGQLIGLFAGQAGELWEELGLVASSQGILTASGEALDKLAPGLRDPPRASRVTIRCSGTPGSVIPAGSQVQLTGNTTRWTSQAAATLDVAGVASTEFVADETGPLAAPAGSTWVTATPVAGWLGAANEASAVVGADLETDAALRARVLAIRAGGSSSSAVGLRSGVLQAAGVTECVVIENDSAVADTEGRPANSVEIVVRGGADADVAAVIWARKPAGLVLTSVVPVESRVSETVFDGNGDSKTVVFSREDRIDVYVEVDYLALPAFPLNGESLIEQALIDFGAALTIGTPVYPPNVERAIYSAFTEPVFRELVLRIGVTANPSSASEVPTGRAQVADFARDRITFTRLP